MNDPTRRRLTDGVYLCNSAEMLQQPTAVRDRGVKHLQRYEGSQSLEAASNDFTGAVF